MSFGSSGSVTYSPNCASSLGSDAFHVSLSFSGMTTSFTKRHAEARHLTEVVGDALSLPRLLTSRLLRDAVLHTPTIGFSSASLPSASRSLGTCNASVLTLKPASVSSPTSLRSAPYRRSKTLRSRKNGSSACPANALPPPRRSTMPSSRSACVVRHRSLAHVARYRYRVVDKRFGLGLLSRCCRSASRRRSETR